MIEVSFWLSNLKKRIGFLFRAWIARRHRLDQCLELQLFYRDCEQADNWMSAREAFLKQEQVSPDNVESLIKKHEDFDKAINSQQEKIATLENFADQLIKADHYDGPAIARKRDQVLNRYSLFFISTTAFGIFDSFFFFLLSMFRKCVYFSDGRV